jgi:uncharacterized protein (TIGR00730 family)
MAEEAPKQVGPAADAPRGRAVAKERRFLHGPQPRGFELRRAWRIFKELLRGFRAFHFVGPCVTVFGSARYPEGHPAYDLARRLGRGLAEAGFTVMTGGGPGVMEAANRGAHEAGGFSIGCNILLPEEQHPNPWVHEVVTFEHFYVRKVMLVKYSYAFVAMPGGLGTLDEVFEIATLIQTKKVQDFPLVLMGVEFWRPLMAFLETLVEARTISREDVDRVLVTDSAEEAVARVVSVATGTFGLTYRSRPPRARRWLFERRSRVAPPPLPARPDTPGPGTSAPAPAPAPSDASPPPPE